MGYSGVFVFGDSLVDPGNALKLANWYGGLPLTDLPDGAPTADKGYFQGRFSDGYTFADLISNKAIGVVTKPVFPYGYEDPWIGVPIAPFASDPSGNNLNFAYGGSHIRQGDEAVPDLDGQTDAFKDAVDGDADPNALYIITTGGNDVRDLALTGQDPVPAEIAYAELDACAAKLLREISQLIDIGAQHIVITGIADVGLIPRYDRNGDLVLDSTEQMRSEAATEYSIYLDMLIRTEVVPALKAQLEAMGLDPDTIIYVPIMDYVDENGKVVTGALNANLQTIADLNGITLEDLTTNWLEHQKLVFFDQIHPNAQANALLGAYMQAQIWGTAWVETKPLLGADVDYGAVGSIAVPGEVDKLSVAMIAGTTYTFQALGVSTVTPFVLGQLGMGTALTGTILADPKLSLTTSNGAVLLSDDDSGIGFDSTLGYQAVTAGTYTLAISAAGSLTGSYVLTATVSGAAMQAGNTYTVGSAATLVIEGVGGIGIDVVKASVSYALTPGSEIEQLSTTNDRGKTAINLTGNEFGQTIVGNSASNVLEGKGGADTMTGGAGNDVFVLSMTAVTDSASVDRITDYAKGDVVDITQVLSVAAGTNVVSGGYVRVTTSGKVQVDLDGGGNDWVTLSTISGTGAVSVRYMSGGSVTTVSAARVAESQLKASAANTNIALAGVLAGAELASVPAAAHSFAPAADAQFLAAADALGLGTAASIKLAEIRSTLTGDLKEPLDDAGAGQALAAGWRDDLYTPDTTLDGAQSVPAEPLTELLAGTDVPAVREAPAASLVAEAVVMPSAEMLQAAGQSGAQAIAEDSQASAEVSRVLADALSGAGGHRDMLEALLDALPGEARGPTGLEAREGNAMMDAGPLEAGHVGSFGLATFAVLAEAAAVHLDVPATA